MNTAAFHKAFKKAQGDPEPEALCHLVLSYAQEIENTHGKEMLTEELRTVWAIETFFGEVCNGGFDQYFFNQSVITAYMVDALERCDLPEYATVGRKVEKLWPGGRIPTEEEEFDAGFDSLKSAANEKKLEEYDNRVYALMNKDNNIFRARLLKYIMDHETDLLTFVPPKRKGPPAWQVRFDERLKKLAKEKKK